MDASWSHWLPTALPSKEVVPVLEGSNCQSQGGPARGRPTRYVTKFVELISPSSSTHTAAPGWILHQLATTTPAADSPLTTTTSRPNIDCHINWPSSWTPERANATLSGLIFVWSQIQFKMQNNSWTNQQKYSMPLKTTTVVYSSYHL